MPTIEVKVPSIGDFKDVPIIEVHVHAGDEVHPEDPLVTLESEKATMDVPSPAAGKVRDLKVRVGDRVSEGSVVVTLDSDDAAATPKPPVKEQAAPAPASARRNGQTAAPAQPASPAPAPAPSRPGPASPAAAARAPVEVKVPSIGDFKDVPVIDVLVKAGDRVEADAPLVILESEKATMDVPSPVAGTVRRVAVNVNDRVSEGSLIAVLDSAEEVRPAPRAPVPAPPPPAAPAAPAAARPPPPPAAPAAAAPRPSPTARAREGEERTAVPHASPSVRKLARELGVDLARVEGSGPRGRILKDDVQRYVKEVVSAAASGRAGGAVLDLAPWPRVDFAKYGPIETAPLARIKKLSAANLARNWVMIPHVTQHDEADITDLERFRVELNAESAKDGVKVTLLAFVVKACVAALKRFPEVNASLDGDTLVLKRYYHLGFAADTPSGLVVPVLHDADGKGVLEIARELAELAAKARAGKLTPTDMQGGTFSISSLGGIGGTAFTPIINAPEVAILGVSRSATRPVWDGQKFEPRLLLPLSLSYDHRVVDGALAARFTSFLARVLGDFRRAML